MDSIRDSAGHGSWWQRHPRWTGAALLFGLHCAWYAVAAAGVFPGPSAACTVFAFGIVQVFYAVPLVLALRRFGRADIAGGAIRGALVTLGLNLLWLPIFGYLLLSAFAWR